MPDLSIRPKSRQPLPEQAEKVFEGVVFDVYQWQQPQYDGTSRTFEKLKRADTVLILPVTQEGKVIFSTEEQPGKAAFFGLLGGKMEEGEEPLVAAERELLEETGFEAGEWALVEALQPISKIEWAEYVYVARGCKKVGEQELDGGEKIALHFLDFDQAVEALASDEFADKEIALPRQAIHALYDPKAKEEIRGMLYGNNGAI